MISNLSKDINMRLLSYILIAFVLAMPSVHANPIPTGLVNGKLRPCPSTPNCISSENGVIAAINIKKIDPEMAWEKLQFVLSRQHGAIQHVTDNYLWAVHKTPVLGFVDDVEARLDKSAKLIHLKSASRVGYYDFGENRKRLHKLIKGFELNLHHEMVNREN